MSAGRLPRSLCPLLGAFSLVACGPEEAVPDLSYAVTVRSAVESDALVTDCVDEAAVFEKTFDYDLFFEGSNVEVRVDGESFAGGVREGCDLLYESSTWLEERGSGDVRWKLTGEAVYEGDAGGCDLAEGLDWYGTEVIEIVESEDESVPPGCTYEMVTEGTLQAG